MNLASVAEVPMPAPASSCVAMARNSRHVIEASESLSGSTPRSAPLRSLRCRLTFPGRLHAPLPSGRCAVVSLGAELPGALVGREGLNHIVEIPVEHPVE